MIEKIFLLPVEMSELKSLIKDAVASSMREQQNSSIESKENSVLLNRKDVLDIFKISSATLRVWMKKGLVPKPVRIGRRLYFKEDDILDSLKNHQR
jgi:predicted DNA-binding transcriptional regulator AlpA